MPIQTFMRYENKYVITDKKKDALLPVLLEYMDFDKYCVGDKDYSIYSLYLDTKNNDVVRRSVQKPYYKEKLRLRSYKLNPADDDTVFLEIKKKIGGIVNKRRVVLTYKQAVDFIRCKKIPQLDGIQQQIMSEICYYVKLHPIEKSVLIHYDRTALFGKDDPSLRITFDRNLTSEENTNILRTDSCGKFIVSPETRIMEIKINGAMPLWLSELLTKNKIYSGSFSKFGRNFQNETKRTVLSAKITDEKNVAYAALNL